MCVHKFVDSCSNNKKNLKFQNNWDLQSFLSKKLLNALFYNNRYHLQLKPTNTRKNNFIPSFIHQKHSPFVPDLRKKKQKLGGCHLELSLWNGSKKSEDGLVQMPAPFRPWGLLESEHLPCAKLANGSETSVPKEIGVWFCWGKWFTFENFQNEGMISSICDVFFGGGNVETFYQDLDRQVTSTLKIDLIII